MMDAFCLFVGQRAGIDLGKWTKHWQSVSGDN
jgi:hypothetical protein